METDDKKSKNYKSLISAFLERSGKPLDVETIRKKCKIGNWNTCLKHCLELLISGEIRGQKTSKSWVFWHPNNHFFEDNEGGWRSVYRENRIPVPYEEEVENEE